MRPYEPPWRRSLINAILILFGAAALAGALSYVGPTALDEHDAVRDAQQAAQRRDRFERAAQAMCGENAGWRELADGAVQCFTKRGHKTVRVTL